MAYDHREIEPKWQKRFEETGVFHAKNGGNKKNFYCLIEFPYPSGAGLHVGHPRSYTALDVVSRKHRMQGENVLYPIGWDAFGLPTENYAIKTGRPPREVTLENIATFKRQLQALGIGFDWSREVDTTDPAYYKWTQWMFLEFFKAGLAYKAKAEINWCPSCKIGLANEEAAGGVCERCGGPVEKREKEQWMIAITKYAERLLTDLDTVDYLPKIKKQQQDWIGKSEGAEISFSMNVNGQPDEKHKIQVFTTRPDTLGGATFLVASPELAKKWMDIGWQAPESVRTYVAEAIAKPDDARTSEEKEKTGVDTGITAINPLTGTSIPVWIADYVLGHYGTGAIMAVPAHDERDFAFAKQFGLPVKSVVACFVASEPYTHFGFTRSLYSDGDIKEMVEYNSNAQQKILFDAENVWLPNIVGSSRPHFRKSTSSSRCQLVETSDCFTGDGIAVNSGFLDGLPTKEAKEKIISWLEEKGIGNRKVTYKLRDWVFSRQRYWGEPIPLVRCESGCSKENGGWVAIPETELPLTLPAVEKYQPTDNGDSPLATMTDWVNTTCPTCGGAAKRETDTMPNWAGSSWYFLRYVDANNDQAFASKEALAEWMPVNWYNGGMEHTVLHLLYSRFWNKFLFDRGYVPCAEPYAKRTSHGLILSEDGTKMSKSKGNVVNPDEIVKEYGADTLRTYILFMGPFAEPVPWSTNGLIGVRRFLDRVDRLDQFVRETESEEVTRALHKTIKTVGEDIEATRFNTAIAAMMAFVNTVVSAEGMTKETLLTFLTILGPFAPHITNEIRERLGVVGLIETVPWPTFDLALATDAELAIAVQVNGKLRATIRISPDADEATVVAAARAEENVAKYLEGEILKTVYVAGRLVNFVVKA